MLGDLCLGIVHVRDEVGTDVHRSWQSVLNGISEKDGQPSQFEGK